MKLFLDTASLDHIKDAVSWGIIDGVTTNPSLIGQAAALLRATPDEMDMESYIKNILASAGRTRPVTLEVAARSADGMIEQGMLLYESFNQVAANVVISIPVSTVNSGGEGEIFDGLKAIRRLGEERVPVNATLVFTPEQALLAAKAGAEYVSPFAGGIDDRIRRSAGLDFAGSDYFPQDGIVAGENPGMFVDDHGLMSGVDLIAQIADVFEQYEIETEIIAASIRNPRQVREIAIAGADIATMPYEVLLGMIGHPGTAAGIDAFAADLADEYLALFVPPETDA